MRKLKSVSGILRVTGIVVLVLSLVLLIYGVSTNGKDWNAFREELRQSNVSVNVWERFTFNHAYFMALRGAAQEQSLGTATRVTNTDKHFSHFLDRANQAEQATQDKRAAELETWFNSDFDVEAFLLAYESQKGNQESAEIREIFEYIDGLAAPPLKSGKVLPGKLAPPTTRPWFEEQYAVWTAEYGEEVGSFLEYMQAYEQLILADGTVTKASEFAETVAYEEYKESLAVILGQEDRQSLVLFTDALAGFIEQNDGSQNDIAAFLQAEYTAMMDRLTASAKPEYAVFLTTVRDSLAVLGTYDGSYSMLLSSAQQAQEDLNVNKFSTYLREFSRSLVENSDNRRTIPMTAFLWYLAANALFIGMIAILMIFSAAVLARITTEAIIKKREYKTQQNDPDTLLLVKNLSQYFKSGEFVNKAVDNISFHIKKGEVFGLVGESGCGKTTTGRTIINLYDPTDGDIYFKGLRISSTKNGAHLMCQQKHKELKKNIASIHADAEEQKKKEPSQANEIERDSAEKIETLRKQYQEEVKHIQYRAFESEEEKRKCAMLYHDQLKEELLREYNHDIQHLQGKELEERKKKYRTDLAIASRENITTKIQMIFQDPIASINPRMTVREIIAEGLIIRGVKDKELIDRKVNEMLDLVGLVPEHASRYPHEFSGGQRQRIGIARAIVLEPELIIADEPISALDVSIQAQIINLLNDLRDRMGLTIMFIAHNLSVVKYFSDRIAVMYYGNIVEMAPSEELFLNPLHPYTKSLLSAIPYPDPHYEKQRKRVEYEPVLAHDYRTDKPELHEIKPGHFIHCNQEELSRYRKELK